MPRFTVVTIDSLFSTETRTADLADADAALALGVRGAIMIAADEINGGFASATVEVVVEDEIRRQIRRSTVSISTASLATGPVV